MRLNDIRERRRQIVADAKTGMTAREISKKHGVSCALVYKSCRKHAPGFHNKRTIRIDQRRTAAVEMIKAGVPRARVAEEMKTSLPTVYSDFRAVTGHRLGVDRYNKILVLVREGKTLRQIERELGHSRRMIQSACKYGNLPVPPMGGGDLHHRPFALLGAIIKADRTKHGWQTKLATERGLSIQRLSQVYHDAIDAGVDL